MSPKLCETGMQVIDNQVFCRALLLQVPLVMNLQMTHLSFCTWCCSKLIKILKSSGGVTFLINSLGYINTFLTGALRSSFHGFMSLLSRLRKTCGAGAERCPHGPAMSVPNPQQELLHFVICAPRLLMCHGRDTFSEELLDPLLYFYTFC